MTTLNDELDDIGESSFSIGKDGIGSRHHDLPGNGIPERKDTLNHFPFIFRDQPLLFSFINQLLYLFFDILVVFHLGKAAKTHSEPMSKAFG